jgi:hypothetical protein
MPTVRRYFRECRNPPLSAPVLTVADMGSEIASCWPAPACPWYIAIRPRASVDSGALTIPHTSKRPVLNPIYIGTRRGHEHLSRISEVFTHPNSNYQVLT